VSGGYLEDDQDRKRRSWWKTIIFTLAYMVPLFWLWSRTDFPDSLGVHITAHGNAGLLENWFYSYLLLERHRVLDDLTFLYMWMPVAGLILYVALPKLRGSRLSLYADERQDK